MQNRPLRKRIYPGKLSTETNIKPVVDDPEAFVKNKVTELAKKVKTFEEPMLCEIWHDKHYCIRYQHGDDNGKRDGIDPETVHALVQIAIPYLLLCSATHAGFRFLNHDGSPEKIVKTVIQKPTAAGMLNVVIWSHMIDPTFFEITIKTAMVIDDFRIDFGQYALEINDNDVILKKMLERRQLTEVLTFPNTL